MSLFPKKVECSFKRRLRECFPDLKGIFYLHTQTFFGLTNKVRALGTKSYLERNKLLKKREPLRHLV